MSFIPAFSLFGSVNPSSINFQDTSTGLDVNIVSRNIFFQNSAGAYLVPTGTTTQYVDFPITAGNVLTINNLFQKDTAVSVTVFWVSNTGAKLYSTTNQLYVNPAYSYQFYYGLIQRIAAQSSILNDTNFYNNLGILNTELNNAKYAISIGSDIASSQAALDRIYNYIINTSDYF